MACLSFIRFTIYENQTRINRSTLDMTRLCYVFPLRFRRFYGYSMNTTTKFPLLCATKKELYALFPALDAAHSRDMSHGNELTWTLDARYTRHAKSSLKYFKILSIVSLIQTNMISCRQYVKHVIAWSRHKLQLNNIYHLCIQWPWQDLMWNFIAYSN